MSEDTAKLILRLAVGLLLLLHGIAKILNPGSIGFIGGLFSNIGLPAFFAYTVYIGEVIAPIMLIVGYKTKLASALIVITFVVIILLAHIGDVFTLGRGGGLAIELQALFLFSALAIFGLGAGKYAIDKE